MGDLPAIIGAATVLLGSLGGAGRFVWNKVETRFTAIEAELDKCEARERGSSARHGVQLIVIELLYQEVQRLSPGAAVLGRAKHLLDDLKKVARQEKEEVL